MVEIISTTGQIWHFCGTIKELQEDLKGKGPIAVLKGPMQVLDDQSVEATWWILPSQIVAFRDGND